MPKLPPTDDQRKNLALRKLIARQLVEYPHTRTELATMLHCGVATVYRRLAAPEDFSLSQLRKLGRVLHFTNEEKASFL